MYILKNNKLEPVQVKIGITDGIYTEVTDGSARATRVVTSAIYKRVAFSQPNNPFGGIRRF